MDARGLDAEHIARSALEVLRGLGLSNVRVGVGDAPIVAEVWATAGTGNWEQGTETTCCLRQAARFPVPCSPFPLDYLRILVTTPAPTVLPPSRMAKRSCSSMAIGVISSIVIWMLSPGMTISVPAGSSTEPVTSVVRK